MGHMHSLTSDIYKIYENHLGIQPYITSVKQSDITKNSSILEVRILS